MMHQFCSAMLVSLAGVAVTGTAIATPSQWAVPFNSERQDHAIARPVKIQSPTLISQGTSTLPVVQTEDWTTKDIKLPWNQVALDKSFGEENLVVFTKSFKYKLGFASNRKERIHARWTQTTVELFIMRGRDCDILFGCESSTNYALPKRVKVTVGGQDYFLKTVDQNTYELTPEFKQAINQTSDRLNFKVDERVNFEIQEEALSGLKNLFAMQPISTSSAPTSLTPPTSAPTPASNPSPVSAPAPVHSTPPASIPTSPVSSPPSSGSESTASPQKTPLF